MRPRSRASAIPIATIGPQRPFVRRRARAGGRRHWRSRGHDRRGDERGRDLALDRGDGRAHQRTTALEPEEVAAEILRRLVALLDVLGHRGEHDAVHRARDVGSMVDGAAGVSRTCLYATDTGLAAVNGATPVSISYSTTPSAYTSERPSSAKPWACSGEK